MEIEDHLTKFKNQIDAELEKFFKFKIKQVENDNKPEELTEIIENLEKFTLNSGKRIRPILFYFGYIIGGGKDKSEILKTSIAIELIHSYLLIHDDIIDRDNFRHGNFSMHHSYAKKAENDFKNINSKHFGISMAIIAGDLASTFGYEILTNSNFSIDLKAKAIKKLNQIISNTIAGEALDVILVEYSDVDVDRIFEMQKYKTAKYTIEGPLHTGAILAGADEKFLDSLSRYAIPIGIAFQIQDDIIGVFGNEKKIGKPVGSDIKEGKKTLLFAKALEKANDIQKQILNNTLGNKSINIDDIDNVRDIIIKTGSLEFSKNKAIELVREAKKNLNNLEFSEENKKFLNNLADFIVQRKY
jgi:geranylgeranyl diphosphate synthase type I